MLVAGIPLYLCASASTPIAAALIAKGLSPGAALVFLLVGPATNAATIAVVGRLVGSRRLWVYLASIALVSLGAGVLLDAVGGDAVRRSVLAEASAEHGAFAMAKLVAAMAFGVLVLLSFWRTRFGEGLAEARDQLRRLAALRAPVLVVGGLCFILLTAYLAREARLHDRGVTRAPSSGARVEIVTSIYPLELIVRALGGDRVGVSTLLPPGASPHTFEPLPGDVGLLASARYFVLAGGGLDTWAEKLTTIARPSLETIIVLDFDAVDGLHSNDRHARHHGNDNGTGPIDPHIWLDPILVRDALIPGLLQRLIAADPGGAGEYRAGAERFTRNLTALDAEIRTILARPSVRGYVAYHDSWRYFARRYGLETLGVVHEFAGEEPTPLELARLVSTARDAAAPAILVEPQFSPRVAEVIAAEFGGRTIQVDPLGTPGDPARSTYEGLMRYNAQAFARALGGGNT